MKSIDKIWWAIFQAVASLQYLTIEAKWQFQYGHQYGHQLECPQAKHDQIKELGLGLRILENSYCNKTSYQYHARDNMQDKHYLI